MNATLEVAAPVHDVVHTAAVGPGERERLAHRVAMPA